MNKILITLILLTGAYFNTTAQKAEAIISFIKEHRPHSYYVKQAELWWKETQKDNKNEKAWWYYYRTNKNARGTFNSCKTKECKKFDNWLEESNYLKELEEIEKLIAKNIPKTFTHYFLQSMGHPDDSERFEALQKAYKLEPDNPLLFDEFVVHYEIVQNLEKRRNSNKNWFKSNDLSPALLNFNYNMLISMKKNGIIITNGDNDTFPLWMLQDVNGIREDITVLNTSLLQISSYRNVMFTKLGIPLNKEIEEKQTGQDKIDEIVNHIVNNKPSDRTLYFGIGGNKRHSKYEKEMYLVGLVFEHSKENLNNLALLQNNFENKYALDYLKNQFSYDIGKTMVENWMDIGYIPGIIQLHNHYKTSGQIQKAEQIKQLGLLVASRSGNYWKNKVIELLN